jgi:hypothetical protein
MKEIRLNKSTVKLPGSWEDLSFKQKLFAFGVLIRVMTGDLKSQPHIGLLNLLIEFTAYRPSRNYFSKFFKKSRFLLLKSWTYIWNTAFLFKYGWKEYRSYMLLWKELYRPDPDAQTKEREIINFNLLRLAEQIQFVFTIDDPEHKIIPQYNFKTNPFPYIKIDRKKYYGKRFELDITAKTDITAREFVDCSDLLAATDKMKSDEERRECINQICAILYPRTGNYTQNMVSGHNNDNLNEIVHMNRCLDILDKILRQMGEEQDEPDFCAGAELITSPVEIQVVDPVSFYGCGGWCAMFTNANTIL